jgi:hypothetical protein
MTKHVGIVNEVPENDVAYQVVNQEMYDIVEVYKASMLSQNALLERLERNNKILSLKVNDFTVQLKALQREVTELKVQKSQCNLTKVVRIKDEDFKVIKDKIDRLIHENKKGVDTLTLIETLEVDPAIILRAVNELKEEGRVAKVD